MVDRQVATSGRPRSQDQKGESERRGNLRVSGAESIRLAGGGGDANGSRSASCFDYTLSNGCGYTSGTRRMTALIPRREVLSPPYR